MLRQINHFGRTRPKTWLIGWCLWFFSLWFLSSGTPAPENTPNIPHLDKIAHFGFFFGGAGLLCAWLSHQFKKTNMLQSIIITTLIGSLVGVIDEYHQTFTHGRSGNDFGDWTADSLGSLTGAIVMIFVLKYTTPADPKSE